jgi:hypothetical protein
MFTGSSDPKYDAVEEISINWGLGSVDKVPVMTSLGSISSLLSAMGSVQPAATNSDSSHTMVADLMFFMVKN